MFDFDSACQCFHRHLAADTESPQDLPGASWGKSKFTKKELMSSVWLHCSCPRPSTTSKLEWHSFPWVALSVAAVIKFLQLLRTISVEIVESCLSLTALVGVFHRHLAADTEGPQDMPGAFQSSKK